MANSQDRRECRNEGEKDEYGRLQDVLTSVRDRFQKRRQLGPTDLPGPPPHLTRWQGMPVDTLALPSRTCTPRLPMGHLVGGVNASALCSGKEWKGGLAAPTNVFGVAMAEQWRGMPAVEIRGCSILRGVREGWVLSAFADQRIQR
jgi:hypothetical protein